MKKDFVFKSASWEVSIKSDELFSIKGTEDAFVCRLSPVTNFEQQLGVPENFESDPGETLLLLGSGRSSNRLCNALYSPGNDAAIVFLGDIISLRPQESGGCFDLQHKGPGTFMEYECFMCKYRHLHNYVKLNRKHFNMPPAGWCSWYSYFQKITSAELRRNVDFLAKTLKSYGLEWIQLDDGWHDRGEGHATNRNFLKVCHEKFPEGMKAESDYIRSRGFRPGIWCVPFMQSAEIAELPAEFQTDDFYIKMKDGSNPQKIANPPESEKEDDQYLWGGKYLVDVTSKAGQAYVKRLASLLADEYGFDYVKIDAQGGLAAKYQQIMDSMAQPEMGGLNAYNKALQIFKDVLGKKRFFLNCAWGFSSTGICEGIRTGCDVVAEWKGIQIAAMSTFNWLYLNTLAFYNDPDVLCVRDPLTYQEARLWTTMVSLTGQLLMLSDFMPELPQERLNLLKKSLPVADIHPMDLFSHREPKGGQILLLNVSRPDMSPYTVLGILNFADAVPYSATLCPHIIGLREDSEYVVTDFWKEEIVYDGKLPWKLELAPHDSTVLGIWEKTGKPMFIGSSRHITMGAVDIKKALWNEDTGIFRFEAEVTRGDDTRYFFYVPEKYQKGLPPELRQVGDCLFLLKAGKTYEKVLRLNLLMRRF